MMEKIRKIIALCMTMVFVFGVVGSASATEDNTSLELMVKDIENTTKAYIIDENGMEAELEATVVEVIEIPLPAEYANWRGSEMPKAYSAKVETSSENYRNNGITASGSISMSWVDVQGELNEIKALDGYWTVGAGTFTSGKIYWGSDYAGLAFAPNSMAVEQSFGEAIGYISNSSTGKLRADSAGTVTSPNGGEYTFGIMVSPSIFD